MFLLQGEIPMGDIGLKGLNLKNMKFCSLFCQKTSKSVSQLHVFTIFSQKQTKDKSINREMHR